VYLGRGKVALVHHWLLSMTGGERVCEAICEIFGKPDIFCLVADTRQLSPILKGVSVKTSLIQSLPFARKYYRYYAPLFPLAVELLDLRSYDLVISSDASVVKGVLTGPETCHICYCHSPMRYAWNMFPEFLQGMNGVKRLAVALTMHYLRSFDHAAAARVDHFVANSNNVKRRILKYYRRESEVIYPPCDLERFAISSSLGDYYLCVGRLVAYKRFELAVQAFNRSGKRLLIVGEGPEMARLKASAKKNIQFLGWVSNEELASLYTKCRALVFPGEEDFGIVPLEVQASGRPVIAYGRGGALETVIPPTTGLFFYEENPEALNNAVDEFEHTLTSFDPHKIRDNAMRFSRERFQREFLGFLLKLLVIPVEDCRLG
jgi:glycosyltransferase involved in cell wall biosynthesis